MATKEKTAVIFGGTGFIGKILVRALAKADYRVVVATRSPSSAYDLKPCGRVGQIVPMACNYADAQAVADVIPEQAELVVNLIGILFEKKSGDFARVHVDAPEMIAKACKDKKVKRFVHISALGIDDNKSDYAATKRAGEEAVKTHFPDVTFLRPSVVFGPDDDFFNKFAGLSIIMPFLPLIGGGHTKFQPVYVGDVVDTIIKAATDKDLKGETIECVGPETVDFKGIYHKLFEHTGRKRPLLPLPWAAAYTQATFLGLLPNPLLTRDQVTSLKSDNVATGKRKTMTDIGIAPTAMDTILPQYLCKYREGGMFGPPKRQA